MTLASGMKQIGKSMEKLLAPTPNMHTVDGGNKDVARYVLTGLADTGQMKLSAGNLIANPEETI